MKPVLVRNALVFWLLLFAMAFGQERRDPTQPSAAIQQRLATIPLAPANAEAPAKPFKLIAIVLSDRDHGTALLQTASGPVRLTLQREPLAEIVIENVRYVLKDFNASSVQLQRVIGP